jgi:hypothetical protein
MYMGVGGVRQTEMQTAEPFVSEPSASEVEVAIGKLKRYKSPDFSCFEWPEKRRCSVTIAVQLCFGIYH